MKKLIYFLFITGILFACSTDSIDNEIQINTYDAKAKVSNKNAPITLGVPTILCGEANSDSWMVTIKAGEYGTPGGFKIEWMTMDDFSSNGYEWDGEMACGSKFDDMLEENGQTSIDLANYLDSGNENCYMQWECEQEYIFRVRAENPQGNDYKSSKWSEDFTCMSQPCVTECLYGYGYWKTHGITPPGGQEYSWPIDENDGTLMVGNELLNLVEIYNALWDETKGDEIVGLKHHLISAKFNTMMTGDDSAIANKIAEADLMIISPDNYSKGEINSVKDALEAYNESAPCEDED